MDDFEKHLYSVITAKMAEAREAGDYDRWVALDNERNNIAAKRPVGWL